MNWLKRAYEKILPKKYRMFLMLGARMFLLKQIFALSLRLFSNKSMMKSPVLSISPDVSLAYCRDQLWVDRISLEWMYDEKFLSCYDRAVEDYTRIYGSPNYQWRMHVIIGLAHYAKTIVGGDFVEFGVHEGNYAYFLKSYFGSNPAAENYWLFDSFIGLDPKVSDSEELKVVGNTYMKESLGRLDRIHSKFPVDEGYRVVPGYLPDTLDLVNFSNSICYLSIDLNAASAEDLSLRKIYPHLKQGAVIIWDDYGRNPKQRTCVDDFAKEFGLYVITLPTGQGVAFKT